MGDGIGFREGFAPADFTTPALVVEGREDVGITVTVTVGVRTDVVSVGEGVESAAARAVAETMRSDAATFGDVHAVTPSRKATIVGAASLSVRFADTLARTFLLSPIPGCDLTPKCKLTLRPAEF